MSLAFEVRASKGYRYLYIVDRRRTPKGPRAVWKFYLGTAETLLKRLRGAPSTSIRSFPFGRTAALLHAARATGLLAALERQLPRRHQDGPTVAELLFLQILGRAERPLSREAMEEWFPKSALPLLWRGVSPPSGRTLRRYLTRLYGTGREKENGEPILSRARVHKIEEEVFRTLLAQGIVPSWLLFDTTNFFTFHEQGGLFQRGHSKDKRYDRNLVGLGLVTLGNIPVLSEIFPGNEGETKVFARVFEALVARLERLEVASEKLVMVFDRGINSTDNFAHVRDAMHVIAALNRQQARRFLRIPLSRFREVAKDGRGRPVLGCPGTWHGFEHDWRVLVTYHKATAERQEARWMECQSKIGAKVEAWTKNPTRSEKTCWRKVTQAIPEDLQTAFRVSVERVDRGYVPRVTLDTKAAARLRASFGKTALITDLSEGELPREDLVRGFVARSEVEDDWKWLKDRYVMSVKPVWLRDGAAVPGHVFLCVMGLLLLRYLEWEARDLGVPMKAMVEALDEIRLGLVRTPEGKPHLAVEQMDRLPARLFSRFQLGDLVPK
jgi:transposase